jgi:hypothetical protein
MRRALMATLVAVAIGAPPVSAAEPGSELLSTLARVPDTGAVREQIVSWVDYRAVESARPGAARPASLAEARALLEADDPSGDLWLAALNGVRSGSGTLLRSLFVEGARWPDVVGFDFLDVDRELGFGAPPSDGLVLEGDFDPAAIGRAFGVRGFTSTDADGHALLCGPAGCDGFRTDLANRELADPFGGHLGRRQPLAVSESELLSSADLATVEAMLDAGRGAAPSLGDDPAFAAVATGLAGEGSPIQATFVPGATLRFDVAGLMLEGDTPEEIRARLAELAATFEPIPATSLLGIGDAATGTEQVVTLALAYPTLEEARVAADVLPRRLETMTSLRTMRPWSEVLEDRGVTSVSGRAGPAATGEGAVATLTLRAPLAGSEPDPATGLMTSSSILYRLFVDMIASRDTAWLAPELPTFE